MSIEWIILCFLLAVVRRCSYVPDQRRPPARLRINLDKFPVWMMVFCVSSSGDNPGWMVRAAFGFVHGVAKL
jgi:hypothetical protein